MTRSQLSDAVWLRHGAVAQLLAVLDGDGEEARVVGGAVRNALLELAIDEIDLATTAVPEEVVRRVTAAGWKSVPTGIEHGTVTVIVDGKPFEVTTLRQDVETYGRRAKVAFGRDWRLDAQRRDFTINALSVAADGTVYDYVGGIADIAARRVRFIGEASARIAEDYLRILRFFRFHAWYGAGAPDAEGLHACILARAGLDTLSHERVRMELLKLFLARHAAPTLAVMAETGILGAVLGGVPWLASFENVVKVETVLGMEADATRRLGALGVWVKEDGERLAQRLRLSNAEAERLVALDLWWRMTPAGGDQTARALLYRLGPQAFTDRVLIAWSRAPAGAADAAWHALASLPQRWTAPVLPLKAADFMQRGIAAGPTLGRAIRLAEDAWIAADFPDERATLDVIADRAANEAATAN
ncbi:MAG TPA: CCA tRNA nucleotidyltransferase [Xanthobacteraceae bacterium]|jgi:poly(A) polymerase|nr:CCA tRNA nucleotidyltransferase [Xanthobacteraceae bacterium]